MIRHEWHAGGLILRLASLDHPLYSGSDGRLRSGLRGGQRGVLEILGQGHLLLGHLPVHGRSRLLHRLQMHPQGER